MAVLQLRGGFYLVGFLYRADDLRTGARRSRNAAEAAPPRQPPATPQKGIETGLPLLCRAIGVGDGEGFGGCNFLYPADDLGTGARKSRNAAEHTPPWQQPTAPQQGMETGLPLLSRDLCDGEEIGVGSTSVVGEWDGGGFFVHVADDLAPPRNGVGVGATHLHHQHGGDAGADQLFVGEELGSLDARAAGGGEDLGRGLRFLHHQYGYGDADEVVCAAYRTLRLRGGAADYHSSPAVPPPSHSWVGVMGLPMVQTIPGTCALVAATVCVEAQHRRKFEAAHGPGTFACRAAAPRRLRQACFRDKVWNPSKRRHERTWDPNKGAWSMGRVLGMMKRLGGARTTNAPPPAPFFLPLKDWGQYNYEDGGLTAETAARLLHKGGPCIGTLFATPEFFDTFVVPGSRRPPVVFRGCRREDREEERERGRGSTMHAVVCFAYGRSNRGRLCIQVLDSQRATGPVRWVDFDEFDAFYVLHVEALSPLHLLDFHRFPPLVYPTSEYVA